MKQDNLIEQNGKLDKAVEKIFLVTMLLISFPIAVRNIFLGLLLLMYLAKKVYNFDFNIPESEFNKYVILFFSMSILSLFKAVDLSLGFDALLSPLFRYFAFYFMALELVKEKKAKLYINLILASKLSIIIYGVIVDLFTEDTFFQRANSRATFVAFAIILCTVLLTTYKSNKFEKLIYVVGIILGVIALITTSSRGAIMGFAFGMVLYLILYIAKNLNFKKIVVGLGVIFILATPLLMSDYVIERFGHIRDYEEHSSITTRLYMWETSLNLIKENPILGIGVGNFNPRAVSHEEENLEEGLRFNSRRSQPHNLFIHLALEQGIISLIIFLIIVFKAYKVAFINYKRYQEGELKFSISLAFLVMLTTLMGHSLVDVTVRRSYVGVYLIILFMLNYKFLISGGVSNEN